MLCCIAAFSGNSQSLFLNITQESLETVVANPAVVVSNPMVVDHLLLLREPPSLKADPIAEEGDPEDLLMFAPPPATGLQVTIETSISPDCKFLKIPLKYSFGQLSINSSIPYFYDRSIEYAQGPVSTTGFGDFQLGLSYDIAADNLTFQPSLNASLPTGNASKQVDGFLIPMGTGSLDLVTGAVISYNSARFSVNNNLSYRLSGQGTRSVVLLHEQGTEEIDYKITNGNTILLNSVFNYVLTNEVMFRAGLNSVVNSDGRLSKVHTFDWDEEGRSRVMEYDDLSANQEFIFFDASAGVQVSLLGYSVLFSMKQPLYTQFNENTPRPDRKLEFYFKFSKGLF